MSSFQVSEYGPVFGPLLEIDRCRALDKGSPDTSMRDTLSALTIADAFAHANLADKEMARCCLSAIWLLYDFLDESHTISQGIATAEGSFWHGIMHRREGDFSNAKYWFRKVGEHPIFLQLAEVNSHSVSWDPFNFVDFCQDALSHGGTDEQNCRQLQQCEWELLFNYCYRHASGT